ncbi:alpha/beta hydrolase [Pseudomonas sp. NA-150]|uniref:alpha/beta hydrolase n=1 Tax=Pseudomonas sp. NA-150 TaxID=3367525 RepID=UPI0037CB9147
MNRLYRLKLLSILLLSSLPLFAQADLFTPPVLQPGAELSVAERGSAYYRFERLFVAGNDRHRYYRLDIAIPRRTAPATGYPVVYLLDGNNALAELKETWLAELDAGHPPVLVMIGYDTTERYDMDQRTEDYTGPGSANFLQLIQTRIKRLVETQYPVDPTQQMLWGHSFGGLFVLYALLENPGAFQTWVAASPSLWFQPETFTKGNHFQGTQQSPARRVLIVRGSKEGKPPIDQFDGGSVERRNAMLSVPPDANRRLAQHLASVPGMRVSYQEYPGLTHGEVFDAALHPALRIAAGLQEAP